MLACSNFHFDQIINYCIWYC